MSLDFLIFMGAVALIFGLGYLGFLVCYVTNLYLPHIESRIQLKHYRWKETQDFLNKEKELLRLDYLEAVRKMDLDLRSYKLSG